MSSILVLKLVLVPSLILAITFVGRRWGPAVAGWLSGFPVVSGPILFFVATEQGSAFAAAAAVGTLSAVLAILGFGLSYAWAATRLSWAGSLACGLSAYFGAVACLNVLAPPIFVAAPVVIVALLFAPRLFPKVGAAPSSGASTRGDMVMRVIAGAALVITVTYFASDLGPRLSGLLAMFPVINSVLAVFSQISSGRRFTINLLRGMVLGYYAFATFCFVLTLTLQPLGLAWSFSLSVACATLVQGGSRLFMLRARGGSEAKPACD